MTEIIRIIKHQGKNWMKKEQENDGKSTLGLSIKQRTYYYNYYPEFLVMPWETDEIYMYLDLALFNS